MLLLLSRPVFAAEIAVTVLDQSGNPAGDAVVSLWPADAKAATPVRVSERHVIDQRDETFAPFVTPMRRGDTLVFTNSDRTRHHVYSFSPIKQFEFVMNPGEVSPAVKFEQTGVGAIGCNIHDKMIAYAYVGDAPFMALTGMDGRAVVTGLGKGRYRIAVWHPRMTAEASVAEQTIEAGGTGSFSLPLTAKPAVVRDHQRHY